MVPDCTCPREKLRVGVIKAKITNIPLTERCAAFLRLILLVVSPHRDVSGKPAVGARLGQLRPSEAPATAATGGRVRIHHGQWFVRYNTVHTHREDCATLAADGQLMAVGVLFRQGCHPMDRPTSPAEKQELPLTQSHLIKTLVEGGALTLVKRAKSTVFEQGQPANSIFYIVRGRVQTTVVSPQGKEGTIALYTRGDFVGEASLTALPLYRDSAATITECELLMLSAEQMRAVLQKKRRAALYFTSFLLQRTLNVQADLVDHLFNSSEKRLARVLLLLANFGHEGRLEPIANVTHDMLAQRVGTTRARVSHFMNKFRRLGLVEYNGTIKVHSGLLNVVLHDSRLSAE